MRNRLRWAEAIIKVIIGSSLIAMLAGCSVELQHDLTEDQANEILVTLQSNGLHAKKIQKGNDQNKTYAIVVSGSHAQKAWQILKDNDLPSRTEKGIDDIFGKNSLIPTATEEKALYLKALQGELAKTLRTIDGVINARVHVVLPEDTLIIEEQVPSKPKAAVFIKYALRKDASLPFKEYEIKSIIANSVKGLETKDVEVVAKEINGPQIENNYEIVSFGALKVTKDSVNILRIASLLIGLVFIIFGIIIFILTAQISRLRQLWGLIPAVHR